MFNHIIVDSELLPIRNSASEGDINAMFKLAGCILNGQQTVAAPEAAKPIIDAMFDHPDFRKDLQRFCDTYVMMTEYLHLQYKKGEISLRNFLIDSCDYMEMMISTMTTAKRQYWNLPQLQECLQWIEESQQELAELKAG